MLGTVLSLLFVIAVVSTVIGAEIRIDQDWRAAWLSQGDITGSSQVG
jgi:hypothetical protein